AIQTLIIAGQLAPSSNDEKRFELETANAVFGGTFTSRLNMNLREDKHWAYGASSYLASALGQRPLLLYASVQTDKTRESIAEMRKELASFSATSPRPRPRSRRSRPTRSARCWVATRRSTRSRG